MTKKYLGKQPIPNSTKTQSGIKVDELVPLWFEYKFHYWLLAFITKPFWCLLEADKNYMKQ